jgi:ribonuclease HI
MSAIFVALIQIRARLSGRYLIVTDHVGVRGNERADQLVSDAVENGIEWNAPVRPSDFLSLSKG